MAALSRVLALILILGQLAIALPCFAAAKSEAGPKPLDPVEGEKQARELLDDLLRQKPEESTTNKGSLIIRDARNKKKEIPARFEVWPTATNWVSVFETLDASAERLVIIHAPGKPNEYQWFKQKEKQILDGKQALVPFGGSDFWLADLGLEFLHWPKQRLLRKEMFRSQFCGVLESSVAQTGTNGYLRVVCWIDLDSGAIVKGEAYDGQNQLFKRFDPTELKKVEGKYQLEAMEMRNRRTGTRTEIRFEVGKKKAE